MKSATVMLTIGIFSIISLLFSQKTKAFTNENIYLTEFDRTINIGSTDTLEITEIDSEYFVIMFETKATGGNTDVNIRFNNDTSTKYVYRRYANYATVTAKENQAEIILSQVNNTDTKSGYIKVYNSYQSPKFLIGDLAEYSSDETLSINTKNIMATYTAPTDTITSVKIYNTKSGSYTEDSYMRILVPKNLTDEGTLIDTSNFLTNEDMQELTDATNYMLNLQYLAVVIVFSIILVILILYIIKQST